MKWESAVLDLVSVRFIFLLFALCGGCLLGRVLRGVFALTGFLLCGLCLRFIRGPLGLWRSGLCAVDRCEHYGRLQGTENKCLYELAER